MARKRPPDTQAPGGSAKGLPSREEIRRFVREQPGRVGKREIIRAFRLGPEDRGAVRELLKDLASEGNLAPAGHRRFRAPGRLPEAMVVQVTGIDRDGEALARPVVWDGTGRRR